MKYCNVSFLLLLFLLLACKTTNEKVNTDEVVNYDSLTLVLETMYDTDQEYRMELVSIITENKPFDAELVANMNRNDSLNQLETIKILNKFGWLPKDSIGQKAASALFLIIQHSPTDVMEKYFPMLKEMVEEGQAKRTDLALMEDRILMYNHKKQIYGSQASLIDEEMQIWPIENAADVNKLRLEIGFETTVEENAESMGVLFNPNVKMPDVSIFEH